MGTATIGSALRSRRSDRGLDQTTAAALIGMSRTTYSSYERDLQRPSVEVLPALARFLEVSTEEILALYGATCIANVRPQLESLLSNQRSAPMDPAPSDSSPTDGDSSEDETAPKEALALASAPAPAPEAPPAPKSPPAPAPEPAPEPPPAPAPELAPEPPPATELFQERSSTITKPEVGAVREPLADRAEVSSDVVTTKKKKKKKGKRTKK